MAELARWTQHVTAGERDTQSDCKSYRAREGHFKNSHCKLHSSLSYTVEPVFCQNRRNPEGDSLRLPLSNIPSDEMQWPPTQAD